MVVFDRNNESTPNYFYGTRDQQKHSYNNSASYVYDHDVPYKDQYKDEVKGYLEVPLNQNGIQHS